MTISASGIDRLTVDGPLHRCQTSNWGAADSQTDGGKIGVMLMGSVDVENVRQRLVVPNPNIKSITVEVQVGGVDAVRDVLLIERDMLRRGIRRKTTGNDGIAVFTGLVPDRVYLAIALDDAADPQFNDLVSEQEVGV